MSDLFATLGEQIAREDWGFSGPESYALGIDMGSYGLRAVLADMRGTHLAHGEREFRRDAPAADSINDTIALVEDLLRQEAVRPDHLVRIGIGFGGPVDARAGVVRRSYRQAGWEQINLREIFEQRFDAATLLENDASLIAIGEHCFGVGRKVQDLFYLHLSSGVGSGMVLDGRLHRGVTTSAGEIGHARIKHGSPTEFEDILSIGGLLRRASELGLQTDDLDTLFADPGVGQQTIDEAIALLSIVLGGVVQLLDPALLVLGGVVTRKGGERFVNAIEQQVNRLIDPTPGRTLSLVASSLGNDAVAVGGLALALNSMRD